MYGITLTNREQMLVTVAYNSGKLDSEIDSYDDFDFGEEEGEDYDCGERWMESVKGFLPPLPTRILYITVNGERLYEEKIKESNESDAVFKWYKERNLDGELLRKKSNQHDNVEWYYRGHKIHIEKED